MIITLKLTRVLNLGFFGTGKMKISDFWFKPLIFENLRGPEVVCIKKILARNLLTFIGLHCVNRSSWSATTSATLQSKCDVGNWIFSKSWEFFVNFLGIVFGISWEFFVNSLQVLCEFFANSIEIILNSLGSYLNMEGIDLFFRILFYVKIFG